VDRMVELLDLMGELSHFERAPAPSVPVDIAELLREAVEDLGASALADGRQLTGMGMDSAVSVLAAAEPLRSALFRIIGDAIHHIPEGQTVRLVLRAHSGAQGATLPEPFPAGPAADCVVCDIGYPGPPFAPNESEALLSLARTGRGTRGAITRRVFRVGLCLRLLVLQGLRLDVCSGEIGDWILRLALPAAG